MVEQGYWSDKVKYADGRPIPLVAERCPFPLGAQHSCKLHQSHSDKHRCICGVSS